LRIEVDCERIRRNAEAILEMCAPHSIEVVGVTKGCWGHPEVARAMLAGGASKLGDSRLKNVQRMRDAGIDAPVLLLRLPEQSKADEVLSLTQMSLNSEVETVRVLSRAAVKRGLAHQVILMVEVGDRREGVMPEQALDTARAMLGLPGIDLVGIGANTSCIGGVLPTKKNMQLLVDVAESVESALGIKFRIVSGGHSGNLNLVGRDEHPSRINQLRIGEAILRGEEVRSHYPLPCPYQNAFKVKAEVIELKTKPSLPEGPTAIDTLGRRPHFEDRGLRLRAILAIGWQDLRIDGLTPERPGAILVGASSDHMVLDVTEADPPVHLGEELEFAPSYAALTAAMANMGVTKVVKPIAP